MERFRVGKELLVLSVRRNLRTMYRDSVLGVVWTVLHPLMTMAVLTFVYQYVFGRTDELGMPYSVYVLSGTILFSLFRNGTSEALTGIASKRSLVLQTRAPMTLYGRIAVYTALVNFFFAFAALLVVMGIETLFPNKIFPSEGGYRLYNVTLPCVGAMLPAFLLFTLGIGQMLSVAYVFFRDIRHLYQVFVTLLSYTTPIYYSPERLNNPLFSRTVEWNPLYHFLNYFRYCITGRFVRVDWVSSPWTLLFLLYAVGLSVYGLGMATVQIAKKKIPFYL